MEMDSSSFYCNGYFHVMTSKVRETLGEANENGMDTLGSSAIIGEVQNGSCKNATSM